MAQTPEKRTRLLVMALLAAGMAAPMAACSTVNGQQSALAAG
ncbi:MAG: hypothetical protein ACRED6_04835 [Stellaceae bacterium]